MLYSYISKKETTALALISLDALIIAYSICFFKLNF